MSSSGRRLVAAPRHKVDCLYDCDMARSQAGPKLNQSVQKAITLLRATAASSGEASVSALARSRLGELSEAVRETVTLSVVAPGGGLDLVYQVAGPQHLVPRSWLGHRFPLHASSSGKILLSTYDEERLERFLRDPLPALTPHTITTRRALRQELDRICAEGHATTVDELE